VNAILLISVAMTVSIRRLGVGDEPTLTMLAEQEADFDLDERGEPLELLTEEAAREFLKDPNVLHWVVFDDSTKEKIVAGHMLCHVLRMRAGAPAELVLYEIGVRSQLRRKGIGRMLVEHALAFMKEHKMKAIWVLADNEDAISFYRSCGFSDDQGTAVYMLRED
jgi:ribosomal protein S18 acetylase RimI-like enzyme